MSRSTSSDRLGQWDDDDDSNRPHKKPKYSPTRSDTKILIEDDADSSTKMNRSLRSNPESNRWIVTRYLGNRRSYGSVYLAESTYKGEEDNLPFKMVIKSIEMSQSSRLMNEEKFLTLLKNPFIISCYGHEITVEKNEKNPLNEKVYYSTLVEYCPGQSLEKHMKTYKGRLLEDDDVKRIARDVLVGLKYIHGEKIIHCDIKPKNILISFDNKLVSADGFVAKISGFGKAIKKGSVEYGEGCSHSQRRGTTRFMSPELIRDMVLDYGADVWAFGCTVYEMLTGEEVWGEFGKLDWEVWVNLIGKSGIVPRIPDCLSEKAKDFLTKCLERDPAKRCSVDCLLNHQFLKWNDAEEEEEEEEEEEDFYYEIGDSDVEAEAAYEEGEDFYDEIDDADVEAYVANLEAEAAFGVEEEAIEIDEEYPEEDSEVEL